MTRLYDRAFGNILWQFFMWLLKRFLDKMFDNFFSISLTNLENIFKKKELPILERIIDKIFDKIYTKIAWPKIEANCGPNISSDFYEASPRKDDYEDKVFALEEFGSNMIVSQCQSPAPPSIFKQSKYISNTADHQIEETFKNKEPNLKLMHEQYVIKKLCQWFS